MARIPAIPAEETGPLAPAYDGTRRSLSELTGREPDGILDMVEVMAHAPAVLQANGRLQMAVSGMDLVDRRIKGLADLKAATLTQCAFCMDIGSQIMRRWGLTDEELLALPSYRTSPLFTDAEKLALDYAVGLTRAPAEVSDELFAQLAKHFDPAQLVELTYVIALSSLRGRFNVGLGIGAAGFSGGAVCAVPETIPHRP